MVPCLPVIVHFQAGMEQGIADNGFAGVLSSGQGQIVESQDGLHLGIEMEGERFAAFIRLHGVIGEEFHPVRFFHLGIYLLVMAQRIHHHLQRNLIIYFHSFNDLLSSSANPMACPNVSRLRSKCLSLEM